MSFVVVGFQNGRPMACESENGEPVVYESLDYAQESIRDSEQDRLSAGMDCDLNWLAQDTKGVSIEWLKQECGL